MLRKELLPSIKELVVCKIREVTEVGAYVQLVEYRDIEGLIMHSEYSRRGTRIKANPGQQEILSVISVDQQTRCIDLSRKHLTDEERADALELYKYNKTIHDILVRLSNQYTTDIESLYEYFVWSDRQGLMDTNIIDEFRKLSDERKPKPQLFRCYLEVACFSSEGVDGIKKAFAQLYNLYPEMKCKIVASPLYYIEMAGFDDVRDKMNHAVEQITRAIEVYQGYVCLKIQPQVVNQELDSDVKKILQSY